MGPTFESFGPVTPAPVRHYPEVDRPVIAVAKEFASNTSTGPHRHPRAQLIYSVTGLMVASAADTTWLIPPGHALWVPAGVEHDVRMHGHVSMRTAYVDPGEAQQAPASCRVMEVTPLLNATLTALCRESPEYADGSRGSHLAALIVEEIRRAPAMLLAIGMPTHPRLRRLAEAVLASPDCPWDLDQWADSLAISRRSLTRQFRQETGQSFARWRSRVRLLFAIRRLAAGEALPRAAAAVGYKSVAAFRNMARRELGARITEVSVLPRA